MRHFMLQIASKRNYNVQWNNNKTYNGYTNITLNELLQANMGEIRFSLP